MPYQTHPIEHKYLLHLFAAFSLLHLIAIGFEIEMLDYLTKPLLVSLLAVWFGLNTIGKSTLSAKFFLTGLFFSVLGDTLLMFVKLKGELYFLLGLGSFLLAHLCYIAAFLKYPAFKSGAIWQQKWKILPFSVLLVGAIAFLWEALGPLRIPVTIYSTVIIGMAVCCYNMKNRVENSLFVPLFSGALMFVTSDMIIALAKFKYHDSSQVVTGLAIMSTYLIGQFLLASSMAKAINGHKEGEVR